MILPAIISPLPSGGEGSGVRGVTVSIHARAVLNRFVPTLALGAGIDGGDEGETDRVFTARNVSAMLNAGLGVLTYRLRTELAGEAWHWNPAGRFSAGDHGYWTSDDRPGAPIRRSFGYRLPRRGNTIDQANNDDYSRLDDGRMDTYWKSNPYLGDRPQWLLVDLRRRAQIDALRIRWAEPYALRYQAEYWDGSAAPEFGDPHEGVWRAFSLGLVKGKGGDETRRLAKAPRRLRFVRIRLLVSSRTPNHPRDPRDAVGFAIREIGVGRMVRGRFVDAVRHRPDQRQTLCYVSSTDPWHRTADRDPNVEQPGLDLVARSPLSRGLPTLVPMPVLYGTPEDDAALARYLRVRGYPLRGFEMGEEPDGQVCAPEDYASLYLRMADAVRPSFPKLPLGGPAFQTVQWDFAAWALPPLSKWLVVERGAGGRDDLQQTSLGVRAGGERSDWLHRFSAYLQRRGRSHDLAFVSFEWYPFDEVWENPAPQLARAGSMLRAALQRLRLPGVPLLMTEYGYSAFAGPAEVDLPGALLNLDLVGTFLSEGGSTAYLYGYPPAPLITEKRNAWGNLALLLSDDEGRWRTRLPTFWAAQTMMRDWCGPARGTCELLRATTSDPLVAAYALRRQDRRTAVLLLNKDPRKARTLRLSINGRAVRSGSIIRYGCEQYTWHAAGPKGRPLRSFPPKRGRFQEILTLPPFSFAVATPDGL